MRLEQEWNNSGPEVFWSTLLEETSFEVETKTETGISLKTDLKTIAFNKAPDMQSRAGFSRKGKNIV